jgi:hypothetical protein
MSRTPRDLDSRTNEERDVYVPPSNLPEPQPQPGYIFRWVATHVLGQETRQNVANKMREGWSPCRAEDHPEMKELANAGGNIEVGGLMLCKMPKSKADARARYYEGHAKAQMESVDNTYLKEEDPRMPKFTNRKSAVARGATFGNGSQ